MQRGERGERRGDLSHRSRRAGDAGGVPPGTDGDEVGGNDGLGVAGIFYHAAVGTSDMLARGVGHNDGVIWKVGRVDDVVTSP